MRPTAKSVDVSPLAIPSFPNGRTVPAGPSAAPCASFDGAGPGRFGHDSEVGAIRCTPDRIDLFCGAGGMSLGLQDAGFSVLVGADNDCTRLRRTPRT